MSAILEIRDGVAVGPIHSPAQEKYLGNGNIVVQFDPDSFPLSWPTMCGVEGYVYDRDGVVELEPGLKDCFECRVRALTKTKPAPARVRRPRRECAECGAPARGRMCRACYLEATASPCGTRWRYILGCRCPECRGAQNAYDRDRYQRRRAA